jgi:cellulose synthase/poly-beta-1,6-N-acetylglucosamine synthase-like glycosyltransferase
VEAIFWIAALLMGYTYAGYALWLWAMARLRPRQVTRAEIKPFVSIVMAVHNEERNLPARLENLRALDYPADRLQVIIVSDGSTDATGEILRSAGAWVTPVMLPSAQGKAVALNAGVAAATGEVLVFFDARQRAEPDAVRQLVACFADPQVGVASGELVLEDAAGAPSGESLGLYWRIEKMVRRLESASGSVVGVTGAIYAMRRELFLELPPRTILDDVLVPMNAARTGRRVLFEPSAIARDRIFEQPGKEFARKVRTLTGNYQLLRLSPWLLTPSNPLLFRLISHKLLRLAVPFLMVLMLASSATLAGQPSHPFFRAVTALQALVYALALLGTSRAARRWKPVSVCYTFVMLNVAAAVALYNFVGGRTRWA